MGGGGGRKKLNPTQPNTHNTTPLVPKVDRMSSEGKETVPRKRRRGSGQGGSVKRKRNSGSNRGSVQPLRGVVLAVSVSAVNGGSEVTGKGKEEHSFSSVSVLCKSLGAEVMSQVCKRTAALVVTASAVRQATQRVRKAYKKRIPIVETGWVDLCRANGAKEPMTPFRLEKEVEDAIRKRGERKLQEKEEEDAYAIPGAGWSEPLAVGCCCVCHENGTEKECPWCTDC